MKHHLRFPGIIQAREVCEEVVLLIVVTARHGISFKLISILPRLIFKAFFIPKGRTSPAAGRMSMTMLITLVIKLITKDLLDGNLNLLVIDGTVRDNFEALPLS